MEICAIGKKLVNFADKDTGKVIEGVTLYCAGKVRPDTDGYDTLQSFFISKSDRCYNKAVNVPIGKVINLSFAMNFSSGKLKVEEINY